MSTVVTVPPSSVRRRVAIVGGGASGVLTAINVLARSDDRRLELTIHEASGVVGRGIAYGTNDQRHLLNVRARHMSAFPDAPSDLLEWALRTGRSDDPQGFLSRADFAIYLQDRLTDVADHRLVVRAGRVEDVVARGDAFEIRAGDAITTADTVVLAYGHLPPRTLTVDGEPLPDAPWYVGNPWDLGRLRTLPTDAHVVLVGTGLTAVDTAITLLEEGPDRRVTMISRHGLLPRPHIGQQSTVWVTTVPAGPLTADEVADLVRGQVEVAQAHGVDWRNVVDGLRSATQGIWLRWSTEERRRFLTRHAREWEVRRHRMAPEVALRLERYRLEGRLVVRSGTLTGYTDRGVRAEVVLGAESSPTTADAIVNCTGPLTDLTHSSDPLLRALRERGLAAPDPLRLGLATTVTGELLDEHGDVVPGLFAVGPPRKGTLWESTAIPEIRAQAAQVAAAVVHPTPARKSVRS